MNGIANGTLQKTIKDLDDRHKSLVEASMDVKAMAYCPYSKFRVGAAVLTTSGQTYSGCNVENAAFPLSVCAERSAINTAVGQGHRKFTAIAISGDVVDRFVVPCGACRQALVEFGNDWVVILVKPDASILKTTIRDLLPMSFGPHDMEKERVTNY